MRNTMFLMVALGWFTADLAPGQEGRPWAERLFAGKTFHDFGNVPHGAQLSHKFPFTNIFQVPLNVTISRISCGCISATSSIAAVSSRESGFIEVNLNTRTFTGPRNVRIYVTLSSGKYFSTAELKVSTFSRPDVVFNPGQVDFGVVSHGQLARQVLDVEYAGALNWRVTEVVPNGMPVEVNLSEPIKQVAGQVKYQLTVALKKEVPVGNLKGEILLKTNDPASPLVPVQVEANIQATLTVAPTSLRPSLKVGEEKTLTVVVRGNKEFRILGVEGLGDDLSVTTSLPDTAEKTHRLSIKIQGANPGDLRRKLMIQTDFQSTPVTVMVEGKVSS